jgi:uncharacterized pyridoxamine 5'-phosphate oxidase family protein
MKDQVFAFLKERPLCVVSTVTSDSRPEAAFVGFTCNEKLQIVIGTSNNSRKYANLQSNPSIAPVKCNMRAK